MKPDLRNAAILLTRHVAIRSRLRPAIVDSLAAQPRAQSYDSDGSGSPPWCWVHSQEVSACHRAGDFCDGETITHNDPTGTAACTPDRAATDLRHLDHLETQLHSIAIQLADIDDRYLPRTLPDAAAKAKLATPGEAGCFYCAQVGGRWSPADTKNPTDLNGNLPRPVLVCSGHRDLVRKYLGRAPTKQENEAYVLRGKWPKLHDERKAG